MGDVEVRGMAAEAVGGGGDEIREGVGWVVGEDSGGGSVGMEDGGFAVGVEVDGGVGKAELVGVGHEVVLRSPYGEEFSVLNGLGKPRKMVGVGGG